MTHHAILWIALAFYVASLLFAVWRLAIGRDFLVGRKLAFILPGFLFHTFFMWERGFSQGRCPISTFFETLTFVAWCLVALHLVIMTVGKINYLTVFYMPIVLIVQLAALFLPDQPRIDQAGQMSWLPLHASVITLGYAAFGLAGAVALMYLVQERQLRTRRITTSFMLLPPILRLETLQGWLIVAGFSLLTIGLASGFFGLHLIQHNFSQTDPKFFWSLMVWTMYLLWVIARYAFGMKGRRMAWLSLAGCIFIFATFWISNSFSQFHRY
jgi:HemX protein